MKTVDIKYIILVPHHSLDLTEANAMKKQFKSLRAAQSNLWIVDMVNVQFIDSSGLSVLMAGLKIAREYDCRLVICNLNPTIKLAFEIAQLDRVFKIFSNRDEIFLEFDLK
ncbi:MAG: STAS domain-containing protein [Trichodesmium sp. MAG_R03]|jgi:anti-anti-sigma factor|nr:STAS domain-containing protein [Trichodesmium sp. MAG_R03]